MLLHQGNVKENRLAFCNQVKVIASQFSMHPNWLMSCMYQESKLDHLHFNELTGGFGLLQLSKKTYRALGQTQKTLSRLSNVEQLELVRSYIGSYILQIHTYSDLCMAVAYPEALGKPANFLLGQETPQVGSQTSSVLFLPFFTPRKTPDAHRYITKAEMESWFINALPDYDQCCVLDHPWSINSVEQVQLAS